MRQLDEIKHDLQDVAYMGPVDKVFLADGDALAIPQKRLVQIMEMVNEFIPSVKRIGIYASAGNILHKSLDDLKALHTPESWDYLFGRRNR